MEKSNHAFSKKGARVVCIRGYQSARIDRNRAVRGAVVEKIATLVAVSLVIAAACLYAR